MELFATGDTSATPDRVRRLSRAIHSDHSWIKLGLGPGAVLSWDGDLDGDGTSDDACPTCEFSSNSEIVSHSLLQHDQIVLQYTGMDGVIAVVSGLDCQSEAGDSPTSFNTTSPTVESLSPTSGFATVGGGELTILSKNAYADASSLRVLIGLESQSQNLCAIISLEYPFGDE